MTKDIFQILLTQLSSPNKQEALDAFLTIGDEIYHQGTVYEEALDAIPILINLLSNKAFLLKKEAFFLLGIVYGGVASPDLMQKIRALFGDRLSILQTFWQNLDTEIKEEIEWDLFNEKEFMNIIRDIKF